MIGHSSLVDDKIAINLIEFGGSEDSGCKLLENRLRAAWHQQKSSKIVL
jgi:hypothetical protein